MLSTSPIRTSRPRLSISLAKVGVVAAIDEVLLSYTAARELLDKLRRNERRSSTASTSSGSEPSSPIEHTHVAYPVDHGSQIKKLQAMLRDARLTLRSYYDAYYRLLGQQYAEGDCEYCLLTIMLKADTIQISPWKNSRASSRTYKTT